VAPVGRSVPLRMPKLSMATTEATLVEWLVADGATVADGQALYLVETEKVETEVPGGVAGVIHCTGEPGVVYQVGAEVGTIDTAD
jgi:pyruvate/2-oxoglutarate dehydrogenase complex dihydrolipoamide acyltransferase (E2) component